MIESNNDDPVNEWLNDDVELPQYYDKFAKNGLETLVLITNLENVQDLEYIGVTQKGHQIIIMNAIKKLDAGTNITTSDTETPFL